MTIQQTLKWVPALLMAAAATPCAAQRPADYKKSGDFYYTSGNYYSATVYYQQYLDGGKGNGSGEFHPYAISLGNPKKGGSGATSEGEIQYRLAESYRRIYNYGKAAEAYERLLKGKDAAGYPEARYGYALALRAQGKDAEAKTQLDQYLQAGGKNSAAAQLELQSIAFAEKELGNPAARQYTVARMADPLNGAETNYAAQWSNGSLLFTSTRPDSSAKGGNAYANRIYTGTPGSAVQPLAIATADGTEQGTATLSPDGSSLYFTRWSYDRGTAVSSIFLSRKTGDSWSEPVRLADAVNAAGASARQPFVTPDGQYLLFSSDRPGGLGGYDIWAAPINGGNFGAAVNLGATVNSAGDDEAPFYHAPSQSLVFASRGRVGLGGLDLYSARGTVGGGFAAAQNLGYPVNSNRDDSYFSTASPDRLLKGAVISSDRGQDACMSLYSVDKQYRQFVAGKVVDCATQGPLAGAQVQVDGRSAATAADGSYSIEVAAFATTNVNAAMEGYEAGQAAIAKPATDIDTLQSATICLKAKEVPVAEAPATDNTVRFDFAKWSLRPETQVTLDTLAAVLQREGSLRAIVTGYTDGVGTDEYNLKLSRERAEACAHYLESKGIPAARIEVVAKGACCPLKPEKTADGQDDPAARAQNRRVEFDIKLMR